MAVASVVVFSDNKAFPSLRLRLRLRSTWTSTSTGVWQKQTPKVYSTDRNRSSQLINLHISEVLLETIQVDLAGVYPDSKATSKIKYTLLLSFV